MSDSVDEIFELFEQVGIFPRPTTKKRRGRPKGSLGRRAREIRAAVDDLQRMIEGTA